LYTLIDSIQFDIPEGILCLAGANGLGKSTFLQVLNYGLTGVAFKPNQKFTSVDDYCRDIMGFTEDYFQGRISPEDKEICEIELELLIGDDRIVLRRGFVESTELRALEIHSDGTTAAYEEASPEERHEAYETFVVQKSGLSSFNEFIFVQSFVLTFDERRHLLFWDPKVLETCLLIFVGVNKDERAQVERLRRQMERAESRVRNLVYDIKQTKDRLADLEAIAKGRKTSKKDERTYAEYEALKDRVDGISNEVAAIDAKILDARLSIADSSARLASLRSSYKAEFEARLNARRAAANHPVVKSSIVEEKCDVCGSQGEAVAEHINSALENNKCPLCGAEQRHDRNSERLVQRLKELDSLLAGERKNIDSKTLEISQLETSKSKRIAERDDFLEELREFEAEHSEVLADTSDTIGGIEKLRQVYKENIVTVSAERDKQRQLSKQLAGQYKEAQKRLEQRFLDVRDRFVPSFNELAHLFLGVDLDILLESRDKSLTLALEVKRTRRRASHELSESQRFFIDIALRMAFAQFSSTSEAKAPLYIDTPEGSLDLAYEDQAGKMIAKFAQDHRVFMTANVNTSQLLRSVAINSRHSGLSIQRLYRWTELSEIQEPQEKKFDTTLREIEKLAKPTK
jgi:DNA repair exonuclease SbcCD ATPase subunit